MKNLNYVEKQAVKIDTNDTNNINEKNLLALISENPKVTQEQLKHDLNLSLATIKRMISKMQADGLVKRDGFRRFEVQKHYKPFLSYLW